MRRIIGLTGYKGSGKSTVAKILVDDYCYTEYSFASSLKSMCSCFGLTNEQLHNPELKEVIDPRLQKTPREIMQDMGTIVKEYLGADIWVKLIDQQIQLHNNELIVISDVRYQNEMDYVRSLGGIIVKINRNVVKQDNHSSEVGFADSECDYVIDNRYDIDYLVKEVKELIN